MDEADQSVDDTYISHRDATVALTQPGDRITESGHAAERVRITGVSAAVAAGLVDPTTEAAGIDGDRARTAAHEDAPAGYQSVAELPDWSDPPTGQVPRVLLDDPLDHDDGYRATDSQQVRGPIWREHITDWDDEPDLAHLADEDSVITSGGGLIDDEDPFDFGFDFPLAPRRRYHAGDGLDEGDSPAGDETDWDDARPAPAVPDAGVAGLGITGQGVAGFGGARPSVAGETGEGGEGRTAGQAGTAGQGGTDGEGRTGGQGGTAGEGGTGGEYEEEDDDGPGAVDKAWEVWTAPLSGSVPAVAKSAAGQPAGGVTGEAEPATTRSRRHGGLGSRLPALPGPRSRASARKARHRKPRSLGGRVALPADQPAAAAEAVAGRRRVAGRVASREGGSARGAPEGAEPQSRSGRRIGLATATGLGFAGVAAGCLYAGSVATLALTAAVVTVAAAECFAVLRRAGYRPATLVGLVAVPAAMVAGYLKGPSAIVLVAAAAVVVTLAWYMLGLIRKDPVTNAGVTLLGIGWVALLGSSAGLILAPATFLHGHGVAIFLGLVLATAGYDVGGLAVGSLLGRHKLAPRVSPNKTWEGLIGGMAVALVLAVAVIARIHPWHMTSALWLGAVVAVFAPLGDLCESAIKRSLGVKDMGSILPGHGGLLDRIDSLLFVFPAAYELVRILHVH